MVDENAADVFRFGRLDDFARELHWRHNEANVPRVPLAYVLQDAGKHVQTRRIDDSEREDDILLGLLFHHTLHHAGNDSRKAFLTQGPRTSCWNLQLIVAEIYIPFWKSI